MTIGSIPPAETMGPYRMDNWQHFFRETMGPFVTIVNILLQHQWAHAMVSAVFLETNSGPIHDHRQYSSAATMSPYETIGSIF